jgi:mono/diheme cytochrome c family protein
VDPVSKPPPREFNASPWLLLAVLASAVGAAALGARDLPDWQTVQRAYQRHDPAFDIALRATPLGPVAKRTHDAQEYCTSCHLTGAGYAAADGLVFAAHPPVGHDPLELGCTPCHGGDPASTAFHDEPTFGHPTPLTGQQAWTACLLCHDAEADDDALEAFADPQLLQRQLGRGVEYDGGCQACHQLGARGGLVGPDLRGFGATPVSDETAPYASRLEQARLQLEDPRALNPAGTMPVPDLGDQEREQVAQWLALQGHITDQDQGAWRPGRDDRLLCSEALYHLLCQPCHGEHMEGRERGRAPGAVPALGSALWRAYASPDMVRHVIQEGRPGSLMEGFRPREGQAILREAELDALVDLALDGGDLVQSRPGELERIARDSCIACHPLREDYLEAVPPEDRSAYLPEHPWRWSLEDWLEDEGLRVDSCDELAEAEDGAPVTVHAGERLYDQLCVHCHDDGERSPQRREASAPALRGFFEREHHDAGYLLASVVVGRADAPPIKWRHQGVTAGEYTPTQLACLARWLEKNP